MPGMTSAGANLPLWNGALAVGTNNGQPFQVNTERDNLQFGLLVNVSAVGGTPSATVEVQWSADGVNWVSASTPDITTAFTAVSGNARQLVTKAAWMRAQIILSGTTPTMTMQVFAYVT